MLGEKLKAARTAKKLSQNEVAGKLLVSRQTISKWENNACLPDLDNFQKICDLYDLNPNELLNFMPEESEAEGQVQKEEREPGKNRREIDSLYFFIPFFFVFVLIRKRKEGLRFSKKENLLLLFNFVFTLFLAYFIYCGIPRTTISSFL